MLQQNTANASEPSGRRFVDTRKSQKSNHAVPSANGCHGSKLYPRAVVVDVIAIAESTPGAIAVNTATFVGYKVGKFWGAILSTLALVAPSVIIITIISFFVDAFLSLKFVEYAFKGIRCAVGLLIALAAIKIFKNNKKYWYTYVLMAAAMLVLLFFPQVSTIYIIIGGGIIGLIISLFITKKEIDPKETNEGEANA